MPVVNRTLATFRKAEFGFLGWSYRPWCTRRALGVFVSSHAICFLQLQLCVAYVSSCCIVGMDIQILLVKRMILGWESGTREQTIGRSLCHDLRFFRSSVPVQAGIRHHQNLRSQKAASGSFFSFKIKGIWRPTASPSVREWGVYTPDSNFRQALFNVLNKIF
jgi:hypothetical protein